MTTKHRRLLGPLVSSLAAALAILTVVWALWEDRALHDLRWKLRPGEVLRYQTVQVMGSPGNETYQEMSSRYTVGKVSSDGTAEVTLFIERTTIRKGSADGPVVWDSATEAPIPKDYGIVVAAAMTGIPLKHVIDPRGRILSLDGVEEIKHRIRSMMGGDVFGFTDMAFSSSGGSLLGPLLPEKPVAERARWRTEGGLDNQAWGKTDQVSTYVLSAVRNGEGEILLLERQVKSRPGEVAKSLKMDRLPPDPAAAYGSEETYRFSVREGVLLSDRSRTWTQGTLTNGKIFRFESRSETTLIERRSGEGH